MKKLLLPLLVAAAPAVGFSQVELISGFNFGQFVFSGAPSTDGLNGTSTGFIRSNFTNNVSPGPFDSGIYRVSQSIEDSFSAGVSTLYWDGSNGSSAWDFTNGTNISVVERGSLVAINHEMVNGLQMFPGDDNNAALRFSAGGGVTNFAFVTDTTGWADFDPLAYSQNNDFNFTFSAYAASGASATISWFLNGTTFISTSTVSPGEFQAFNVDLPSEFYGDSAATLVGVVGGDVVIDHIQINGVAAIPEPSSFAALAGVFGLGFAALRRRRSAA